MNKILRFIIPFILAFMFLSFFIYLARASDHAVAASPSSSLQGTIIVTTLQDEVNNDGNCSLREAITAVNENIAVDACPAGNSVTTDTISFDISGTITLSDQLSVTAGGPLEINGGNVITLSGGGMTRLWWVENGSVFTLQHLAIVEGYATDGGGLYNNGGSVLIDDCTWSDNIVDGGAGGGIYNNAGTLVLSHSTLSGNIGSVNGGGGIYNNLATLMLIDSYLYENSAYDGGGIRNTGGTITVTHSTLSDNFASVGGAISNIGTLLVTNSTLSGNHADYVGAAIYSSWVCMTVVSNSTLSGNIADSGGALSNSYGTMTVTNSIIASYPAGSDCMGLITDGGHNISSDDTCGFLPENGSLPNTNPLLGPLQDNGGPTWTHALLEGSPAIDAGDDTYCPGDDQRGVPRPQDGDNNGTAVCDIGSYELEHLVNPPTLVTITGPGEGMVDHAYSFIATVEPITTTPPLEYIWQASGQAIITHTSGLTDTVSFAWDIPGTQAITVTTSNSAGLVLDAHEIIVTDVPISGLAASNDSPTMFGESTILSATIDSGTNVIYAWDFGDDENGSGYYTSHTYASVGTYTATVTATNSAGSSSADTQVIIQDVPISGLVAVNDSPTLLGETTTLSATIQSGTNVTYTWDFGDDQPGSGQYITHTYASVGTYTATVTATNSASSSSSGTQVVIQDIPISGLVVFNDSPTQFGDTTTFTATISSGTNVIFDWDFGDGLYGSGAIITHNYLDPGFYTVTVTATNSINSQTEITKVTINAPSYQILLPMVTKAGESHSGSLPTLSVIRVRVGRVISGVVTTY